LGCRGDPGSATASSEGERSGPGFRVQGAGFGVRGSGFGVWGSPRLSHRFERGGAFPRQQCLHALRFGLGFRRRFGVVWGYGSQTSCASKVSLRRTEVHCTCGRISPYSGRDCVKSLQSSCMGLYPQSLGGWGFAVQVMEGAGRLCSKSRSRKSKPSTPQPDPHTLDREPYCLEP